MGRRRRREAREADEIGAFMRRMCRALRRRAEAGDLEALVQMVAVRRTLEAETREAARALVAFGYSYAELGQGLGMTKQGAFRRFAPRETGNGQ